MNKKALAAMMIALLSAPLFANELLDSTSSTNDVNVTDGGGGLSSGAILGLYRYNTSGRYGVTRYKNWSTTMCNNVGGDYVFASTSSRRRTSQGTDVTFLCLSK